MKPGSTLCSVARKALAPLIIAVVTIIPSAARADPGSQPYQCPGSNAHVWNLDQCARLGGGPATFPGAGGGGHGGLLDILHDLSGGLL